MKGQLETGHGLAESVLSATARGHGLQLCGDTIAPATSLAARSRGSSRYGVESLERIIGSRSDEIEAILGYEFDEMVVQHNDLVVL